MDSECSSTGKAAKLLATASAVAALLLFSPLSAIASEGEETTTTTIITRQEGSNNQTETSSLIVDRIQGLQDSAGDLAGNIEGRIDELISSATNNTTGGDVVDMQLSGKIASARINLNSGQVEQTFFGNWSMDVSSINNASFSADFAAVNNSNVQDAHYTIGNMSLTSFQRINDHVVLGGTVDVAEEVETQSWEQTAVSILVIGNKEIAIIFEEQGLSSTLSQPLIGISTDTQ